MSPESIPLLSPLPRLIPLTQQAGATYVLAATDMGTCIELMGPCTVTIPSHAAVPFPVGATVELRQMAVDPVVPLADTDVVIHNLAPTLAQYTSITLSKRERNEWVQTGGLVSGRTWASSTSTWANA